MTRRSFTAVAAGAVLATMGLLTSPIAAHAVDPTTSVGALVATGDPSRFTFAVTLTGFTDTKDFMVFISTSEGTLDLPVTSGLTELSGYPAVTGNESDFGFTGSYDDVEAALAEVGITTDNASSNPNITVSLAEDPGEGFTFSTANGHYYEFVQLSDLNPEIDLNSDAQISWSEAKAAAEASTLFGLSGYLVTITSRAENDFVADKSGAENVWIGAGRKDTSSFSQSSSNPGLIWEWKTGPEAGTAFAKQKGAIPDHGSSTPISGRFNYWADGEPNNWQYEEDPGWWENYAVTNWNGGDGEWNDLPDVAMGESLVYAFLVEYGGTGAFDVETADSNCGYASSESGVPCVERSSGSGSGSGSGSEPLAATGVTGVTSLALFGGVASLVAGTVALTASRRRQRATRMT